MSALRLLSSAVLLALLATGCAGFGTEQKRATPDPCELVSADTVASVVGPAIAVPQATSATVAACSWQFKAETVNEGNLRRPFHRALWIHVMTWQEEPCAEVTGPPGSKAVDEPGTKALVTYNDEREPSQVKFCLEGGYAAVQYASTDAVGMRFEPQPAPQAERTLLDLAREIGSRWAKVRTVVDEAPPTRDPKTPKFVDACELMSNRTLDELGTAEPAGRLAGAFDQYDRKGSDCLRTAPDTGFFQQKTGAVNKRLVVTVTAFLGHDKHDGADWADLFVEQWATGWSARSLSGLGDRAAVVTDGSTAQLWLSAGQYTVQVEYRHEWRVQPKKVQSAPAAELEAAAEKVAREVLPKLPR